MKKQRFSIKEKLTDELQLPTDIMLGAAILTLSDNRILKVENLKGIISCEDTLVRLLCKHFRIDIIGEGLQLSTYSKDEVIIKGSVHEIHYIVREGK